MDDFHFPSVKATIKKEAEIALEKKLEVMDKKICYLAKLRKSTFENYQMVKKAIQSQIDDIMNLLRDREQKLCNKVEESYSRQNLYIQEELYKLYSAFTQYQTIYENMTNFKDHADVLTRFCEDRFVDRFVGNVPKELLVFDAKFEDLKSAVRTYGQICYTIDSEIIPSYPSKSNEPDLGMFRNIFTSEDSSSQNTATNFEILDCQFSPLQTKTKASLSNAHSIINEKPTESVESFEIIDSPEDLTLQKYIIEPIKEEVQDAKSCKSLSSLNMKSFSSNKSLKVSDWLDKSNKIKNSISCISLKKLEKNEIDEPLYQLKKQLQKMVSDNSGSNNGTNCKTSRQVSMNVHNTSDKPITATCDSVLKSASILSSDIQEWLQNPVSYEPLTGNHDMLMHSVFSINKVFSPTECIQQAFSSYFVKESADEWLCNSSCKESCTVYRQKL